MTSGLGCMTYDYVLGFRICDSGLRAYDKGRRVYDLYRVQAVLGSNPQRCSVGPLGPATYLLVC